MKRAKVAVELRWNRLDRRGFLGRMIGWALTLVVSPWLTGVAWAGKKIAVPLSRIPDLVEAGGGAVVEIKGEKILIIRRDETTIAAISPDCRHKKCQVLYKKEWGEIRCKCHGSKYTTTGKVINPPATKDLFYYDAALDGDKIVLTMEKINPDAVAVP